MPEIKAFVQEHGTGSDTFWLIEEVETIRAENERLRILLNQYRAALMAAGVTVE